MGNKETATKLLLAMATAGLTTCDGTGAVDPAPPPLKCENISKGESLGASGSLNGLELDIKLNNNDYYGWKIAPTITAVSGRTIDSGNANDLSTIDILATRDMCVKIGRA